MDLGNEGVREGRSWSLRCCCISIVGWLKLFNSQDKSSQTEMQKFTIQKELQVKVFLFVWDCIIINNFLSKLLIRTPLLPPCKA